VVRRAVPRAVLHARDRVDAKPRSEVGARPDLPAGAGFGACSGHRPRWRSEPGSWSDTGESGAHWRGPRNTGRREADDDQSEHDHETGTDATEAGAKETLIVS
jgi:hypothetical protein